MKIINISLFVLTVCLIACNHNLDSNEQISATYDINSQSLPLEIKDWKVIGTFTFAQDSLLKDSLFCGWDDTLQIENPDTMQRYWYCGVYHPKYNQMDLHEVFGISPDEEKPVLDSTITYLSCKLNAEQDMDLYLEVKKGMKCWQFMNGDTLHKRDIQGLNIYPIHLNKGVNNYTIKMMGISNDYTFEATVYDSIGVARLYADGQCGNIVYTEILNNIIMITNAHQRITATPVKIQFHDVYGKMLNETVLKPDTLIYDIPELEPNVSYICSMIMEGDTVQQAVLNGKIDDVVDRLTEMRDSLPTDHPRRMEIDEVFYRLNFLLNHPTRYDGDWWWQFKIGALTYQLEHTFAHLNKTYGQDKNEYNVKFITYRSSLDGGQQRYVLVTPNKIDKGKKYPLAVVMRPNIVNHHHLFACPQIARQWAVNIMQSLADQCGTIIMMPEARMFLDEEMIPMADEEMMLAIDDVKKHYSIDEDRIFLHANCSGGYRALQFAERHPNIFAAIGLYAPEYNHHHNNGWSNEFAPNRYIDNLKAIPMLVFGDPIDPHSPPSFYQELLKDGKEHGLSIETEMKRNSGLGYNIVVTGKEAFDFFSDKSRKGRKDIEVRLPKTESVIADFYGKPFIYVYNASDKSKAYKNLLDSIRAEYESYLFSTLPLVPDIRVTRKMLKEKNVFFIGDNYTNHILDEYVKYMKEKQVSSRDIIAVYDNPSAKDRLMIMYNTNMKTTFKRTYPWRKCVRRIVGVKKQ